MMGIVLAIWSFKQLSQSHLDSGFIFFFIIYVMYISYFNRDKHTKNKKDSMTRTITCMLSFWLFKVNEYMLLTYYLILILINLWKMLSISSPGQSIFSSLIQCINPSINES